MSRFSSLGRQHTWQLIVALGCAVFLPARAIVIGPPDRPQVAESDELLEFVLRQNETSRSMLPAGMSYTFTFDRPLYVTGAQLSVHGTGDGRVVSFGDKRFVEFHRVTQRQRIDDEEAETADFVERWVLNPQFFAWWHVGSSPVQIFEHTSIDNMNDHAQRLMAMTHAPEPALYAFGTGEVWLRKAVESPGVIWEARQVTEAGATKFQLSCFSPANPQNGGPRIVVEVDPLQGFCVTRITSYSQDGSVGVVQRVHNREVAPNIWLPELVEQTIYLSESLNNSATI